MPKEQFSLDLNGASRKEKPEFSEDEMIKIKRDAKKLMASDPSHGYESAIEVAMISARGRRNREKELRGPFPTEALERERPELR